MLWTFQGILLGFKRVSGGSMRLQEPSESSKDLKLFFSVASRSASGGFKGFNETSGI